MALFIWGLSAVWLTGLFGATYLVLRDGPPGGLSVPTAALVLACFWAGGIGLAWYTSRQPCIFVIAERDAGATVTWWYPHRVVRKIIAPSRVLPAKVVESDDSDGPYFHTRVNTVDGERFDIAEGPGRIACERSREQFNAALFGDSFERLPIATREDA